MERADFHIHFNPNQQETAFEAIDSAHKSEVSVVGLVAKSEVVEDFDRFVVHGERMGIKVLSGLEHFTLIGGKGVDLIGLGFDTDHPTMVKWMGIEATKAKNKRVAKKQRSYLESEGYEFGRLEGEDKKALEQIMSGKVITKAIQFCNIIVNTEQNGKETPQELWSRHFAPDKDGYVPIHQSAQVMIDNVHESGGVVLYSPEGEFNEEVWEDLKDAGVDGIMAWHGSRLGRDKGKTDVPLDVIREARREDYLVLGGSDFQQKDWEVGVGKGNMFISPKRVKELEVRLNGT